MLYEVITNEGRYIYCENGWYDSQNDISFVTDHAFLEEEGRTLRGDTLYYESETGFGRANSWIQTWSFSETIHSRSYTHIIRNITNDPAIVFDDIVVNQHIVNRAKDIAHYYDELIALTQYWQLLGEGQHQINGETVDVSLRELKKKLYMCLMSVNALEAIRFYVSFACSFAFAERELMEGNAKIIKLIARDEALHLTGTQHMLNILRDGSDDPDFAEIAAELQDECFNLFKNAAEQEKEWAEYLFKDGSMLGLNKDILCQYVEFITNVRMQAVGLPQAFEGRNNFV